jgi:secreted Zn-dependent insulinase-like peptidase
MRRESLRGPAYAGNLETLDIGPKKRGVDTRDELVEFYTANYSSNLMRLVVYGRGKPWVI